MYVHHVYPLNDLQDHLVNDEDGACECRPTMSWLDEETGLPLGGCIVVHNSFDLREMFEEDGPWR